MQIHFNFKGYLRRLFFDYDDENVIENVSEIPSNAHFHLMFCNISLTIMTIGMLFNMFMQMKQFVKLERSKCNLKCEFHCKHHSIIKYKTTATLFFWNILIDWHFFHNNLHCHTVLLDMVFKLTLSVNSKSFMILFLNNKLEWTGSV